MPPALPHRARAGTRDRRQEADRGRLYNFSFSYWIEDPDFVNGQRAAEEAVALYRELGDEAGLTNALWGVGNTYYFQKDWSRSAESYTEALAFGEEDR